MLGIIFLVLATQIPMPDSSATTGEPGPRVFPYISGFLLVISGLGLLIQKQRDSEKYLDKAYGYVLAFCFCSLSCTAREFDIWAS